MPPSLIASIDLAFASSQPCQVITFVPPPKIGCLRKGDSGQEQEVGQTLSPEDNLTWRRVTDWA
jgi:hypothetical protein